MLQVAGPSNARITRPSSPWEDQPPETRRRPGSKAIEKLCVCLKKCKGGTWLDARKWARHKDLRRRAAQAAEASRQALEDAAHERQLADEAFERGDATVLGLKRVRVERTSRWPFKLPRFGRAAPRARVSVCALFYSHPSLHAKTHCHPLPRALLLLHSKNQTPNLRGTSPPLLETIPHLRRLFRKTRRLDSKAPPDLENTHPPRMTTLPAHLQTFRTRTSSSPTSWRPTVPRVATTLPRTALTGRRPPPHQTRRIARPFHQTRRVVHPLPPHQTRLSVDASRHALRKSQTRSHDRVFQWCCLCLSGGAEGYSNYYIHAVSMCEPATLYLLSLFRGISYFTTCAG